MLVCDETIPVVFRNEIYGKQSKREKTYVTNNLHGADRFFDQKIDR